MASLFIGVAGGSGAGKSTIVDALAKAVGEDGLAVIPHDAYYRDLSGLPALERVSVNYDHPDALETSLLLEHLAELKQGRAFDRPVYDFAAHVRSSGTVRVEPRPVIVVDGMLVLAVPELRAVLDVRVFVDTDADIRLIRRIARDVRERGRTVDSVIDQYCRTTRLMHLEFVEPSKRWAHVIVPEGGGNEVGIEMLVSTVRARVDAAG